MTVGEEACGCGGHDVIISEAATECCGKWICVRLRGVAEATACSHHRKLKLDASNLLPRPSSISEAGRAACWHQPPLHLLSWRIFYN